jgi:hypothetical protein
MKHTLLIITLVLFFCLPAFASDLQQQQSTLYPYRRMIEIQDDFMFGINTSGNIGYGWGFANGSTAYIASEAGGRIGLLRRDTTAASGTLARTDLSILTTSFIDPASNHSIIHVVRVNNADADTQVRLGAYAATFTNPPTSGIFFEKLFADTNWFCITRNSGVQTRVDSGVAVDTNFHTFAYTRNSSGVQFSIDNVNVCGLITTNITGTFLDPGDLRRCHPGLRAGHAT